MQIKKITALLLVLILAGISLLPAMQVRAEESVEEKASAFSVKINNEEVSPTVVVDNEKNISTYTLQADGEYLVHGSTENTRLIASASNVTIILNDVIIDNSKLNDKNPVILGNGDTKTLTIQTQGTSKLIGNAQTNGMEEAPGAVIEKKGKDTALILKGDGSLTVTEGLKDTPQKNHVLLSSDGIKSKGSLTIDSGDIRIESYGDGIQAEDASINGGKLNITTKFAEPLKQYEAAESTVGDYNKTSLSSQDRIKTQEVIIDTGSHKGIKVGSKAKTEIKGNVTTKKKAASGMLRITGGEITVNTMQTGIKANNVTNVGYTQVSSDWGTNAKKFVIGAPEDAISSNKDCEISGGSIHICSADDGISASGNLTVSGEAKIAIEYSYEGIEAENIRIKDQADISIVSRDDGMNAAKKTYKYIYANEEIEDYNYTKVTTTEASAGSIEISGGTVEIYVGAYNHETVVNTEIYYNPIGDGIDSNGSFTGKGGRLVVYGLVGTWDSLIDAETSAVLSSGIEFLGIGGAGLTAYGRDVVSTSGQGLLVRNGYLSDGEVKINGDSINITKNVKRGGNFILYTSPRVVVGKSYTVNSQTIVATTSTKRNTGGSSGGGGGSTSGSGGASGGGGGANSSPGNEDGESDYFDDTDSTDEDDESSSATNIEEDIVLDMPLTSVTLGETTLTFNGKTQKVSIKKVCAGEEVVASDAYSVEGESVKDVGIYTLTITAKKGSGYTGTIKKKVTVRKGATSFTAKTSKTTVKASSLKKKKQTSSIKITNLSAGSSKPIYSVKSVSNKMRENVSVTSAGRIIIKKGCKKCNIKIAIMSKANKNRNAVTKIVTIKVK